MAKPGALFLNKKKQLSAAGVQLSRSTAWIKPSNSLLAFLPTFLSLVCSGAYIFRPNVSTTFPVAGTNAVTLSVVNGPVINEARQVYSTWATQVRSSSSPVLI